MISLKKLFFIRSIENIENVNVYSKIIFYYAEFKHQVLLRIKVSLNGFIDLKKN